MLRLPAGGHADEKEPNWKELRCLARKEAAQRLEETAAAGVLVG